MQDLPTLREEIDRIDEELCTLLCRRMDCSLAVAAYKAAHNLPILNAEREEAVLRGVRESCEPSGHGYGEAAALVFSSVMDISRALQHRQNGGGDPLRHRIEAADHTLLPTEKARIVCAGCAGAYADEAAHLLFPGSEDLRFRPIFVDSFADVCGAIKNGEADYGILPVENSSTGSVNEVYDLIMAGGFPIVAATEVPIHHCLVASPGTTIDSIRTVYSHHQGLSQCADFVAARGWEAKPYSNTATAARMVAERKDPTMAAIASRKAANIYGLDILSDNIQSVNANCTRFIAISSKLVIPADANKISLRFGLPHTTGSLYRTLARFALAGLNLTKIESRPIRTGEFEYAFYLDFEGSVARPDTLDLLCALSDELPFFSFLGNYKELIPSGSEEL